MRKSVALLALTLTALAFVPTEALTRPVSVADAQKCTQWQSGYPPGTITCAYCEKIGRRTACHWFACDSSGCEGIDIVENKRPPKGAISSNPGGWTVFRPF